MTIVFFDPPYSNYFDELGNCLINRYSHECVYFDPFNINFMYYRKTPKLTYKYEKLCENQTKLKTRIKHIAKTTVSLSFPKLRLFQWTKALEILCEELARLIGTKDKLTFILYNDLRWHHAIIIQVCKDLGIRYFVFERGAIRGQSISCDTLGVNARSNFYLNNHEIIKKDVSFDFKTPRQQEKFIELRFALHLMSRTIANKRFDIPKIAGRGNVIADYCYRYACRLFQGRRKKDPGSGKYNDHYLVALQLEYDSQIMFGSSYTRNQEFIDDVINVFRGRGIKLIFKTHPNDNKKYNYYDYRTTLVSTPELLSQVKGVVTINSTVGFEALLVDLPVMCFGQTFYTLNNCIYKQNECTEFLAAKSSKINFQHLVSLLAGNYLYPGDIYNYNKSDIDIVSENIIAHAFNNGR